VNSFFIRLRDYRFPLLLAAVLIIAGFNLFFRLDGVQLWSYDEARHGVTAYEMMKSGDYIRGTYLGETEYWNLKPPLGLWAVAASYRVFGVSVFSLRFPSALSAWLSILLVILMSRRKFGDEVSLLSGIILCTCFGFILYHSGRTGDFDALFALTVTASLFFLDLSPEKPLYLVLAGFFASLAFLTKSFAVLQIFAITFVYVILSWKKTVWKVRHFLFYLAAFLIPVLAWAYFRYRADGTAFFQKMVSFDLLNRSQNAIEGHVGGPLYYLGYAFYNFFPWSLPAVAALFYRNRLRWKSSADSFLFGIRSNSFFRVPIFWIWAFVPLLLFSFAKTKIYWYITPIYPALSVMTAWFLFHWISEDKKDRGFFAGLRKAWPVWGVLFFLFCEAAGIYKMYFEADGWQLAMRAARKTDYSHAASIYYQGVPSQAQAQVFYTEAVMGLQPVDTGISGFVEKGKTGDLLFMKSGPATDTLVLSNRMTVITNAFGYLLLRK
jgi:4-amino-4-deoxy-L-arabinose transferase-like glycosyltransferase